MQRKLERAQSAKDFRMQEDFERDASARLEEEMAAAEAAQQVMRDQEEQALAASAQAHRQSMANLEDQMLKESMADMFKQEEEMMAKMREESERMMREQVI